MRCWSCGFTFQANIVMRDGLLRGRGQERGGPYRAYKCPNCSRISKVEDTPKGRLFASPGKDIGLVEFLFGWIEPLTPDDFLKINDWHAKHAERRQHFFEKDGDRRYSRSFLRTWLGRLFRSGVTDDEEGVLAETGSPPRKKKKERPSVVPHPYRVLGVPVDATPEQVRKAFHRLARKWHPDKQTSTTPEQMERAAQRLAELVKAYETLRAKSDSST